MIEIPIQTERLTIRKFKSADLDPFLQFMLDPESIQFLIFEEEQKTEAGARELFDFVCSSYESEDPIHSYAIAETESDRYLGSCGFANSEPGAIECYYCVNREYRGRGIATEAMSALVGCLAGDREIRLYCHPENRAAHAVAEKCGFSSAGISMHDSFKREGILFKYPAPN